MFTNPTHVLQITGKTVTNAHIQVAQSIVESFAGRTEDQVHDPDDFSLMAKAVAYQAVYMVNDSDKVFEQVAILQQAQMDGSVTLNKDMYAPFLAPLTVLTLKNASWRRSRSVKTGPVFSRSPRPRWDQE